MPSIAAVSIGQSQLVTSRWGPRGHTYLQPQPPVFFVSSRIKDPVGA